MAGGEKCCKSALCKINLRHVNKDVLSGCHSAQVQSVLRCFFPTQRKGMNFLLIDLIFLLSPFRPDGRVYCNTHDEGVSYGSLCVSTMVHLMCSNLFYRVE